MNGELSRVGQDVSWLIPMEHLDIALDGLKKATEISFPAGPC